MTESAIIFDDPSDAPDSSDLDRLARIHAALQQAGYTVDGVRERLGEAPTAALDRDLLLPAEVAVDRGPADALAAFIRVYLLAQPVALKQLPAVADQLAVGLLEPADSNRVRACIDIRPYAVAHAENHAELWVASDLGGVQIAADRALRRDHVVGIGPATTNLAQITPRDRVDSALDLGVGMGVQTMHLLSHARRVVATDISARAIAFARFNLLLNAHTLGIDPQRLNDRVELRIGDLLEPVEGETFDLVVSNPPFVITPRTDGEQHHDQYTYRDGGRPGDRLVEELMRGLGAQLRPGGIAVMLGNWEIHRGDSSWHSRIEGWVPGDIDCWVVQRERASGIEYADMWLKDAQENRELTSWREQFLRYLDDFAAREVESVGMGMLMLHRPEVAVAEPVRRFETLEHQLAQPLGASVRAAFSADDWLRQHGQQDLFDETYVVAPDVTEERHRLPDSEHPNAMLLRQGGTFRRTYPLSTELAAFVSVCDGELTGAQIVAALSGLLEISDAQLRDQLDRNVRELVAFGFITPLYW
ncbi:methyltransferase [uncultured Gulosibacter sp.]|uniref:DUF7059 domain-containing protein n=1 Tax=uncultured Gulosibacter sp. TaxID=1339167 RepID=UPI002889AF36|nr:methyltransferase [uncultured Gulosibacter sp.]